MLVRPNPEQDLRILLVTNRFPSARAPGSGTFVPPLRRALEGLGACVECVVLHRRARGRRVYLGARRALREAVQRFRPDVVHVLWGGLLAWITVEEVTDIPRVISFGGMDLYGVHLSKREGVLEHLSRFVAVAASRLALRRVSHVVLVSPSLAALLPSSLSVPRSIVPAAVDPELFVPLDTASCRRELGWSRELKHVLFPASSSRPEKRFELAQAAIDVLRDRGHGVQLHALMGVTHENVPKWMNAADVVLLTSRWEGSPRVLREALACGRPVVSVAAGDAAQWLAPLARCRIARPDPVSIADDIEATWNLGHLSEARELAVGYDWTAMARAMVEIYRSCRVAKAPALPD